MITLWQLAISVICAFCIGAITGQVIGMKQKFNKEFGERLDAILKLQRTDGR